MTTTTIPSISSREAAGFLSLPYELRLEIYQYLLVDSDADVTPNNQLNPKRNGAAILRTCRQIHAETLPILYSHNRFLASDSLLTRWPRLRASLPPVQHAESSLEISSLLTRFRLSLRLDIPPRFTADAAAREFSGKQELVIDVSQVTWRGAGPDHLRYFEGVRGVKKAEVVGSTGGFEGYVRWLEQSMMAPVGSVVEPFSGVMERGFDVTISPDEDDDEDGDGESSEDEGTASEASDVFSRAGSEGGSSLSSSPIEASMFGFRKR